MFYRLIIFSAIALFVYWVVTTFITPALMGNNKKTQTKISEEDKEKEQSILDRYNEAEITYRTAQNELSQLSEEQAIEAERRLAEAQAVKDQIQNKNN